LQQEIWPADDLATRFIGSPLIAILLYSVAFAVATLLVRSIPSIGRTLAVVEAGRQSPIDGLRGWLGVSVFIHHSVITWFFLHNGQWKLPPLRFITHLGQTSVVLFFMITAFLFWGRVLDRGSNIDWLEFLVSRIYRLYPAYLLMVALLAVAVMVAMSGEPASGRFTVPLLHWIMFTMFGSPDLDGMPGTSLIVAGVTWSLRYEWLFYLTLPLLGFIAGRSRQLLAAFLSVAVLAAIFHQFGWQNTFDLRILLSFLGGIAAAHFVRKPALAAAARTPAAGLVAVAALAAVIVFLPTAYTWQATVGLTVFFIVIASGHSLWGTLRLPGLLWLGDITYSIYLLHGLLLWMVLQYFLPHVIASNWVVFLGSTIVIDVILVLFSSMVFLWIERPAVLLGKRHYRQFNDRSRMARAN
jgi:peptidoglycan/LPS O-acetylase OafA/YrhL